MCDFNLSKILQEERQAASSIACANPLWLAPEVLDGQSATFASVSDHGLTAEKACSSGTVVGPRESRWA